jgi:hypothetical protein
VDKHWGTVDAARLVGRTPKTLENWRNAGRGPAYIRLNTRIVYSERDLSEWINRHRVDPEATTAEARQNLDDALERRKRSKADAAGAGAKAGA